MTENCWLKWGLVAALVAFVGVGCGLEQPTDQHPSLRSRVAPEAVAPGDAGVISSDDTPFGHPLLAEIHGQFRVVKGAQSRPVLRRSAVRRFARTGGWIEPSLRQPPERVVVGRARVSFAQAASQGFELQDTRSGATLEITLDGARTSKAQTADGYVIYPAASQQGEALLFRPRIDGVEDFVRFLVAPDRSEVRYQLRLGPKIAGLRLVSNVLEFLDSGGAPRLRLSGPKLIDARGQSHVARLSVDGCAFSTDPRPPWGRAPTAPAADRCSVVVRWSACAVSYPALLDPLWTVSGSMYMPRSEHRSVRLLDGRVLVVGGAYNNGAFPLDRQAELYDPATGSWATVSPPSFERRSHTVTLLTDGRVLAVGGIEDAHEHSWNQIPELFDPQAAGGAGPWSATSTALHVRREGHAAVLLGDGTVLVAGGRLAGNTGPPDAGDQDGISWAVEIYEPGTDSWIRVADMDYARHRHTISLLADGRALVVGGEGSLRPSATGYDGGAPWVGGTAELYDPDAGSWSRTTSMTGGLGMSGHSATALPDGRVLVAGGMSDVGEAMLYDPAADKWQRAPNMDVPRYGHVAVLVDNGRVLLAGGEHWYAPSSLPLNSAEFYEPEPQDAGRWVSTEPMVVPRLHPSAVLLQDGRVFVMAGKMGYWATPSSELFELLALGATCQTDSQCHSFHCVQSVCCNAACQQLCQACSAIKKGYGDDGQCEPIATGTDPDDD